MASIIRCKIPAGTGREFYFVDEFTISNKEYSDVDIHEISISAAVALLDSILSDAIDAENRAAAIILLREYAYISEDYVQDLPAGSDPSKTYGRTTSGWTEVTQSGGGTTGPEEWILISDDYQVLNSGGNIVVDTADRPVSIGLPTTPDLWCKVLLVPKGPTYSINKVTILTRGNTVNGATEDFTISTNGQALKLTYLGSGDGWVVAGAA